MVTIPKGYTSISLVIPQHIKDALESEIIEKWGYLRRGVIGEIARNALEEYLNRQEYERSKTESKKNGLALFKSGENRVNSRGLKVASEVSILLSDIKSQLQQSADDSYFISHDNLVNILIRKLGITDKRGHHNKIKWMTTIGLLTQWQEYRSVGFNKNGMPNDPILVNNYLVNPEFLVVEEQQQQQERMITKNGLVR